MKNKKKQTRQNFKSKVFNRDENKCRKCGAEGVELDAHHITDRNEMPNGGYVLENGISLCEECHNNAEVWHSSDKFDFIIGYHPDDLYKIINSNHRNAFDASYLLQCIIN